MRLHKGTLAAITGLAVATQLSACITQSSVDVAVRLQEAAMPTLQDGARYAVIVALNEPGESERPIGMLCADGAVSTSSEGNIALRELTFPYETHYRAVLPGCWQEIRATAWLVPIEPGPCPDELAFLDVESVPVPPVAEAIADGAANPACVLSGTYEPAVLVLAP